MTVPEFVKTQLSGLQHLQDLYRIPVADTTKQSPSQALASLDAAVKRAPASYSAYLGEAVQCYGPALYRGSILLVWAATVEHLYLTAAHHAGGVKLLEAANQARFGQSRTYREIRKKDDFLYLGEANWLLIAEDAGLLNRNARDLLTDRLKLRNRCGHPTGYSPGREETVVFIESLLLNVVSGAMLNW